MRPVVLTSLSLAVLFTFPVEMSSKFGNDGRQEMLALCPFGKFPFYPCSLEVNVDIATFPKPRKTIITAESEECENGRNRKKRQILKPVEKLPPLRTEDALLESLDMHIDFIINFMMFNEWVTTYVIFPSQSYTQMCFHFVTIFSLKPTTMNLRAECGNQSVILRSSEMYFGRTRSLKAAGRPIFSFHFFDLVSMTSKSVLSKDDVLIQVYNPKVHIFGGNKRNAQALLKGLFVETEISFKLTLVWTPEDGNSRSDGFILEDYYGFPKAHPIPQVIGSWTKSSRLNVNTQLMQGSTDFQGRMLRITTVGGPPFVMVNKTETKLRINGYLSDIVRVVARQLNFTYVFVLPSDNAFGSPDANGTWSGMVGMLLRKEAEIAMMSFSVTAARKGVMDFSPPVEYSSVRLLIRRDWEIGEVNWAAFMRPLSMDVCAAVPIVLVLGVITLSIISYVLKNKMTIFKSTWLLSSCFIMQGQAEHDKDKSTPVRLVIGIFWILAVVLFATYTARLTAYLASSTDVMPIKSLQQAVKTKNWKVGLVKGSAFIDRIKESRVDVLRALYHKITDDPSALVGTFQEGMDKVYKERFIFFTSELIPKYLIKENCSYTWLPDMYYSGFGCMGYQKNLPFAPVISDRISEVRESGQMRRLYNSWWGKESLCLNSGSSGFLGMGLFETGAAFLILSVGLVFSMTLVVSELLWRYRLRRQTSTSQTQLLSHHQQPEYNTSPIHSAALFQQFNPSYYASNTYFQSNFTL